MSEIADLLEVARIARATAIAVPNGVYQTVAQRDGVTADEAYVLVMMWAWPIGPAIREAVEKARDNHPDWQAWLAYRRAHGPTPSLAEWTDYTAPQA